MNCPACQHHVSHHRTGERNRHNASQSRCAYQSAGTATAHGAGGSPGTATANGADGFVTIVVELPQLGECPCQLHRDEATELRRLWGGMSMSGLLGRFWRCEDNGEHLDFVATSLEHAQKILADAGWKTTAETDKEFGVDPVEWRELTFDEASTVFCNDDEHDPPVRAPLTMWAVGMWFGSMFP